jgi:hypothetical protein
MFANAFLDTALLRRYLEKNGYRVDGTVIDGEAARVG